jgi:HlyD family secretion protein
VLPTRVKVVLPASEPQGTYLKPEMGVSVTFLDAPSDVYEQRKHKE